MYPHQLFLHPGRLAPKLIAFGLTAICLAQLVPGVPIAAAIVIIGCGSSMTGLVHRSQPLLLANLLLYTALAALAIAAQVHAAQANGNSIAWYLIVDHAAALGLLVALLRWSLGYSGE